MAAKNSSASPQRGIEERETFIDTRTRPKQEKRSAVQEFLHFLWNKEEKKFLGRTGLSWLEIIIFYVIFYACLALFWAALLYAFLLTLSKEHPRYYGKGTIIGINPGLGYQPWIKHKPDSTLIRINPDQPHTYKGYKKVMAKYLSRYDDKNNTRDCTGPTQSNKENNPLPCAFDRSIFEKKCSAAEDYGYAKGEPCVILTLNRLLGWQPVAYPENSEPSAIKGRYKPEDVAIDCRGEFLPDNEHIGKREYIPESGIAGKYFPYKVAENYHQPVAMVKFSGLPEGVLTMVECRAYAYNILHDSEVRLGLIHFEVMVDRTYNPEPDPKDDLL